METSNKTNTYYPIKSFNDNTISDVLERKEKTILVGPRSAEGNTEIYKTFDEQFSTYLMKLPSNNVKKYVQHLFNSDQIIIGIGAESSKAEAVFGRVLITKDNKLAGVVLDSPSLDIDIKTGETNNIDNCVYASYFNFIRAVVICNETTINKDMDLHKLLSTYINLMILRTLGQNSIYNEKYKTAIFMTAIYVYFRHFTKVKHSLVLSYIKREFRDILNQEYVDEFLPTFQNVSKYDDIKDIPKILVDLGIFHSNPSSFTINLLRIIGNSGFYNIVGSLDRFIATIITAKYPTDLFSKGCNLSSKTQDSIEYIMSKYMNKVKYGDIVI